MPRNAWCQNPIYGERDVERRSSSLEPTIHGDWCGDYSGPGASLKVLPSGVVAVPTTAHYQWEGGEPEPEGVSSMVVVDATSGATLQTIAHAEEPVAPGLHHRPPRRRPGVPEHLRHDVVSRGRVGLRPGPGLRGPPPTGRRGAPSRWPRGLQACGAEPRGGSVQACPGTGTTRGPVGARSDRRGAVDPIAAGRPRAVTDLAVQPDGRVQRGRLRLRRVRRRLPPGRPDWRAVRCDRPRSIAATSARWGRRAHRPSSTTRGRRR